MSNNQQLSVIESETIHVNETVLDITKEDVSSLQTKSAKIRYYHSRGYSRSQIAKHMGIIYQHVRNVLITPIKTQK